MRPFTPVFTLTLNPALDETWMLDDFSEDRINRVSGIRQDPSGKGVNVSRLCRVMGVHAPAAGFAGGANGERLRSLLRAEGVEELMTAIAGETRRNLTLQVHSGGRTVKINHPGPEVTKEEFGRLCARLEESLPPGSFLALCGSLPPGVSAGAVADLLQELSDRGVRICIDCEPFDVEALARIRPFLCKPNLAEFEALAGKRFPADGPNGVGGSQQRRSLHEAVACLSSRLGTAMVVSLGAEGAIAASPDGSQLHMPCPVVHALSTVGAGDAMLGGMLSVFAGYLPAGRDREENILKAALRLGVAAGAAKVEQDGTGMPVRDRILELYSSLP